MKMTSNPAATANSGQPRRVVQSLQQRIASARQRADIARRDGIANVRVLPKGSESQGEHLQGLAF